MVNTSMVPPSSDTTTTSSRIAARDAGPDGHISLLHFEPPICPNRFFGNRPWLFGGTIGLVLTLAFLAALDGGSLLDEIDQPITEWVVDQRTPTTTDFFNSVSRLGDNIVVFAGALTVAAITWRKCRYVAIAFLGAVAFRPLVEFVLKAVIDRERPDLGFQEFEGPSHPSGHPMAAASFFGLIPAAVALYTHSHRVWTVVTAVSLTAPPLVAAARVYKGAHWTTDVVASLLWGALYLLVVQGVFDRFHPIGRCEQADHHD